MDPLTGPPPGSDLAFTCLVPVHAGDESRHFVEAMTSVARSSLRPTQVLICQDGPLPDALGAAVAACEAAGARLTRNTGAPGLQHNLNSALGEVRTPWVARADADDINLPDRFEAQARFLGENPAIAVLGGGLIEFFPDGRRRGKAMPLTHDAIVRYARWRNPINHMTAFYRTEAVLGVGGYPDLSLKEDYGLWVSLIAAGRLFANLARPLVRARLGGNFHDRRSGLQNLSSEYGLYRLKRRVPRIGAPAALLAMAARAGVLAAAGPTRLVYEGMLRR